MKTIKILILFSAVFYQSCITFKESTVTVANNKSIEAGNCSISSTGIVNMNMFGVIKADLMPNSIKIKYDSTIIYIDPINVNDPEKADYIFVTHKHLDHFSKKDIKELSKTKSIVIGPGTVTKKLKGYNVRTAFIGDTIDYDDIKYETVESYNTNSKIHKKGSNFVGYVITCGTDRIYIAGDTDLIPEMKDLEDITVAIMPIGVGKTAMNPESAAEAARIIKPGIVIPVHYELNRNSESEFLQYVDKDTETVFFITTED